MAEPEFTLNLDEADFDLVASPGLALLKARREIEGRIRWLEERLAPDAVGTPQRRRKALGTSLVEAGIGGDDAIRAISELIAATDPIAHGDRPTSSSAAVVVELAVETARSLDELLEATQQRIAALTGERRLAYDLLGLPTSRLLSLAREHSIQLDTKEVSRPAIARQLVARASQQGRLPDLERATQSVRGTQ